MALQGPFFGKREPGEPRDVNPRQQPLRPAAGAGAPVPAPAPAVAGAQPFSAPMTATSSVAAPVVSRQPPSPNAAQLTVGRNIKLKGVEITDCDTLVVEGQVEATVKSRLVQISEEGSFKGSVQADIAEVRGVFDGDLTVSDRLVVHATGKVSGKIRYGKIVIEEGGQLSGEVAARATEGPASASAASAGVTEAATGA